MVRGGGGGHQGLARPAHVAASDRLGVRRVPGNAVLTDERTLAFLRELEQADEEAAATLAELDELAAELERIRARALELEAFRTALPGQRRRVGAAVEEAGQEVADRRADLEAVEVTGESASQRALLRAEDALRMGEKRLGNARADLEEPEAEAAAAEREAKALEERGRELAEALGARAGLAQSAGKAPAGGLGELLRWATDARAALFVARGNLAKEREALIRQANELGALVLGEPLTAGSPADIARRIERSR